MGEYFSVQKKMVIYQVEMENQIKRNDLFTIRQKTRRGGVCGWASMPPPTELNPSQMRDGRRRLARGRVPKKSGLGMGGM